MVKVAVTVDVQGRRVALEQVKDARVRSALEAMGRDIGAKLAGAKCPEHGSGPTAVRIHVDGGDCDLAYESCCEKLRGVVSKLLG